MYTIIAVTKTFVIVVKDGRRNKISTLGRLGVTPGDEITEEQLLALLNAQQA